MSSRPARRLALVALLALPGCGSGQVQLASPTTDAATRAVCRDFVDALPDTVDDERRRPVDPGDALGAAWGDPAIVVICGGPTPAGFDGFSACQVADGVGWWVPEEQIVDQSVDAVLTTVGFEPNVQVRLPAAYRPEGAAAVMIDLAPAIKGRLRLVKPCV